MTVVIIKDRVVHLYKVNAPIISSVGFSDYNPAVTGFEYKCFHTIQVANK